MIQQRDISPNFLQQLSKYYMEFLENDFKLSRPPSRRIKREERYDTGVNIHLQRYSSFSNRIMTLIRHNFQQYDLPQIGKKSFTSSFSLGEINRLLKENERFEETLKELLKTKPVVHTQQVVQEVLEAKKREGDNFSFWLADYEFANLYQDLVAMWQQKQVLEQQEAYLYFMSMTYKENIYPLFYVTMHLEKEADAFSFENEPVLLINQKAISYLMEQHRKESGNQAMPDLPPRHIYLSQFSETGDLLSYIQTIVDDLCEYIELPSIDVTSKSLKRSKNETFSLQNDLFFSLFDKSDESLLNDYEEFLTLLQKGEDTEAFSIFSSLIESFLFENPLSVEREVEQQYEERPLSDKFTYYSPIPLNKEQQQVLHAIQQPDAKHIVIEGPPGTGKSHTITAIIYNALLQNQSVLMVSDKEEALDVVESKINETLDSMKLDDFVQNPVLRLGKKNNNYQQIFSQLNFTKIKNRHSTYQKEQTRIENEIKRILTKMKKDIQQEVNASKQIELSEIQRMIQYEPQFAAKWESLLPVNERHVDGFSTYLRAVWESLQSLKGILSQMDSIDHVTFSKDQSLFSFVSSLKETKDMLLPLYSKYEQNYKVWTFHEEISTEKASILDEILRSFDEAKHPWFGYFFQGKNIKKWERTLKDTFLRSSVLSLKKHAPSMEEESRFYQLCDETNTSWKTIKLDIFQLIREKQWDTFMNVLVDMEEWYHTFERLHKHWPQSVSMFQFSQPTLQTLLFHTLSLTSKEEMEDLVFYLTNLSEMDELSTRFVESEYNLDRKKLEERLVLKMTHLLDESVIDFRENYRNDAAQIRQQFRSKQPLSKDHLQKLVKAFPCLIVGIRELGDYLPLEPHLFDLVIIDEASQVSIAQAFPAILRAKKVVVLGDSKQFGNVKSHNATKDVNQLLFKRVKDSFSSSISETVENQLNNFNIKNSILEFMKNIANYHTVLKKHFRGYYELIDYSNRYFYDHSLEVMKLRTKPLQEIIQFTEITPSVDIRKNINESEALFILAELQRLKETGFKGTVGIITPFREQQKWLSKLIYEDAHHMHYLDHFHVKVMTFDSCQGEERDIIYYSMVEKEEQDSLKYIFPVHFSNNEDNLKSQRLNVGFSRVKESARFVISQPPSSFTGEIGRAIQHFYQLSQGKDHQHVMNETDVASPMEKKMVHWIMQTPFYQKHREFIELVPQFEMGKYIKQLDPTAVMPDYRIDFLFLFHDGNQSKTVILEYDGFEYHFQTQRDVHEYNYRYLYTESDIERQKTIESYGYPFIRMNKFIVKNDPVSFLNQQLEKYVTPPEHISDGLSEEVAQTYKKIEEKQIKSCRKCGEMKELVEFFDPTLKSNYGHVCMSCKKK